MTATLTDDKPLATNVAAYIGQFTMTEALLQTVFEKAVGGDGTWADVILHHIQSISTRVDMIEDFLKNCSPNRQLAEAILPIVPEIRRSITYRNKLAHGLYVSHGSEAYIHGNMFSRKKNFKMERVSAEGVLYEYHRLEQLHVDMLHALDAAPPGFPRKLVREFSPKPDVD